MSDLEQQLARRLETDAITNADADAVREFAAFLAEAGPHPNAAGHDPGRWRAAFDEHREFLTGGAAAQDGGTTS